MGRGLHKNWSHSLKRKAYNARKSSKNYKKGGENKIPLYPYAGRNKRA